MNLRSAVMPDSVEVFTTCPQSPAAGPGDYRARVIETAWWAEQCRCKGALIYADNSLVDPWLVAQVVVETTQSLSPLVAVQPVYMHPYSVAKMVASMAFLYGRRVYLNMIAGGFTNDLLALDDPTPHDRRYDRLVEYASLVLRLVRGSGPVSFRGDFYRTENLRLTPALPGHLEPGLMVSGSSEAGTAAASALGAVCVHYPKAADEYGRSSLEPEMTYGIRIGIICRASNHEAWEAALNRFPEDRRGRLLHQYAMKTSDSVWHKQLSDFGAAPAAGRSPYWLGPFENYKTFCPYLVGAYDAVGAEIAKYIRIGYKTFILDIPSGASDLAHAAIAFREAAGMAG